MRTNLDPVNELLMSLPPPHRRRRRRSPRLSPPPSQGLWPVFCPVAFECSCLVYLTFLKVYFERVNGRGAAGPSSQQSSPLMESSSINGAKAVGGARRSPSIGKYGAAGYAAAPDPAPKV